MKNIFLIICVISSVLSAQTFIEVENEFFDAGVGMITLDYNNDSFEDIIALKGTVGYPYVNVYLNDGNANFTEFIDSTITATLFGGIISGDVNGDGYEDILVNGQEITSDVKSSRLYINMGNGVFEESVDVPFVGVTEGTTVFLDINNDLSLDLLITGGSEGQYYSIFLYENDGDGNFTEILNHGLEATVFSKIGVEDVNGDSFTDVLITGLMEGVERSSKLYMNTGNNSFTENTEVQLEGVYIGDVAFIDVNADAIKDLIITGRNNEWLPVCNVYLNDGEGNFSETEEVQFNAVSASSIALADMNGDLIEDIFMTGINNDDESVSKLYLNNGEGNFTELNSTEFEGVHLADISLGDFNGDSYNDIIFSGIQEGNDQILKVYLNNGEVSNSFDNIELLQSRVNVYPNPITDNEFNLDFESILSGEIEIEIINSLGQVVHREMKQVLNKVNSVKFAKSVKSGIYSVKIIASDKNIYSQKIVIIE